MRLLTSGLYLTNLASAVLCERPMSRFARTSMSAVRYASLLKPKRRQRWALEGATRDCDERATRAENSSRVSGGPLRPVVSRASHLEAYAAATAAPAGNVRVNIRHARTDDIDEIQRCNRASLPENYNDSFYVRHLTDWGNLALVAEADREIAGYVLGRVNERGTETPAAPDAPGAPGSTQGHITSLAVNDRYRRKGVAKQLMLAVHKEMALEVASVPRSLGGPRARFFRDSVDASASRSSRLHVRCSNAGALQLYASLGATPASRPRGRG